MKASSGTKIDIFVFIDKTEKVYFAARRIAKCLKKR